MHVAQALDLSPALATGLILVSCCPGGQVRNASPLLKTLTQTLTPHRVVQGCHSSLL